MNEALIIVLFMAYTVLWIFNKTMEAEVMLEVSKVPQRTKVLQDNWIYNSDVHVEIPSMKSLETVIPKDYRLNMKRRPPIILMAH